MNVHPGEGASTAPDLSAFLRRVQRLPRLGDAIAPWHFRGWLLPYVILIHERCPAVANRWGYHLRTLDAATLLDEPIPQIVFGAPDPKVHGFLHDWCRLVGHDCGGWSDFRALLDWLSWGLALTSEEPRLSEQVNETLYREVHRRTWQRPSTHPKKRPSRQEWLDANYFAYWYPLMEWGYDRERCKQIIAAAGLPVPIKSACFFCPASKNAEIAWLQEHHPELLERALRIERNAQPKLRSVKGLGRSFAWASFHSRLDNLPLLQSCGCN